MGWPKDRFLVHRVISFACGATRKPAELRFPNQL
jgi:hypothetical protein